MCVSRKCRRTPSWSSIAPPVCRALLRSLWGRTRSSGLATNGCSLLSKPRWTNPLTNICPRMKLLSATRCVSIIPVRSCDLGSGRTGLFPAITMLDTRGRVEVCGHQAARCSDTVAQQTPHGSHVHKVDLTDAANAFDKAVCHIQLNGVRPERIEIPLGRTHI